MSMPNPVAARTKVQQPVQPAPCAPASCFTPYDIRGRVPEEMNPDLAFRIGAAYAERFMPRAVALGRDMRPSSVGLLNAVAHGLASGDVDVLDLGLCGTEEVYFAAMQSGCDGGIMITASDAPAGYNGMKLVRARAVPVTADSGLRQLERDVAARSEYAPPSRAPMTPLALRSRYIEYLLDYVDSRRLRKLRIVVNAGHGTAGLIINAIEPFLPFEFIKIHQQADSGCPIRFVHPMQPQSREVTAAAVLAHHADFGITWDSDFDRCFLFDERGQYVEAYYIVGLLAQALLKNAQGSTIIHDPRLVWNTVEMVSAAGGVPLQSRTGHAFVRERMRAEQALYGGEASAHHYFRDFSYCDNGNIPWLLIAGLLCQIGLPLSQLVAERKQRFPVSGEIKRSVADTEATLGRIERSFGAAAQRVERIDGLSLEHADWRCNVHALNTGAALRINVESRGDPALMQARTQELLAVIDA